MSDLTGVYSKAADKDFLSTVGNDPVLFAAAVAGASIAVGAANQAILVPVKAPRAISIAKLLWFAATQSGNYDIGIYNAAGTRLWSKGSTAFPTGTITETVSPVVAIPKGQLFYVAIAADNATATMRTLALISAEFHKSLTGIAASVGVSSSFPLPSTIVVGTTTVTRIPAIAIREV